MSRQRRGDIGIFRNRIGRGAAEEIKKRGRLDKLDARAIRKVGIYFFSSLAAKPPPGAI
jgi:hypothetical protein